MSDDRRAEGLARLEAIERELVELKGREEQRQVTLDAILQAMNYCGDAIGTLVTEVAELSKAAQEEPKSDIGLVLRKLAEAVEKNTAAVTALSAQIAARRGGTH